MGTSIEHVDDVQVLVHVRQHTAVQVTSVALAVTWTVVSKILLMVVGGALLAAGAAARVLADPLTLAGRAALAACLEDDRG